MKLKGEKTINDKQVKELCGKIEKKEMSKGAAIREMFAGGMAVKEIATATGIRYNHVYNVVNNEVLVKGLSEEIEKSGRASGNTRKAQILELLEQGKTITEVSRELRCLYNQVWQVAKLAGYTKKQQAEQEEKVAEG